MQRITKILISVILLFIIGVFFLGLNKDSNYNTKSLVGKIIPNIAPCRVEHPILIQLSKKKNLKLLGVNFKDNKKQAITYLNDFGDPYDFFFFFEQGKHSVAFGVYGIPESILVNNELIILKKFVGPLSIEDFNSIIEIVK